MYCRNCGNELVEDVRFCKKCGTAVRGMQREDTAAPESMIESEPQMNVDAGAKPIPTAKPAAAKPAQAVKTVSGGAADKVDGKLIAAVLFFLMLQMAVVLKVVSIVDTGAEVVGAMAETVLPVDGATGEDNQSGAYFSKEIYVGGKVEFGRYEQDGNTQNGPEPIEWDVVDSFEDGYILVSRYILDGMPWDDGSGNGSALELKTEITYEQCSMRRWIRDSFSMQAFTEEERAMIIPVSVKGDDILAKKGNQYATDYAFILREDEVMDYWGNAAPDVSNASLPCAVTEYAGWSGLEMGEGQPRHRYGNSYYVAQWALRRRYTDANAKQAKIVTVSGAGRFSNAVVTETLGFRPAIYISGTP